MCLLAGQGSIIGALFFNGSALCSVHAEHLFLHNFSDDGTATSGSQGISGDASEDDTDSDVSSLTSVDSGSPSGVEEGCDNASDTENVYAKSDPGVWRLANVFANEKLYCTRDVPEPDCLPQGLEPPAKPAAKPSPKAAKLVPEPQPRVQPSLWLEKSFQWPLLTLCGSSK